MKPVQLSFLFLVCVWLSPLCELGMAQNSTAVIDVGVVLDLETWVGKMSQACISMALSDFYTTRNHNTTLVLHMRDSKKDIVGAAAEVLDLMKNVEVKAIVGPMTSAQTEFVVDLGAKAQVPILAFSATSPSLNSIRTPYFIRTAQNDSSQVEAIAAIVNAFGWREVVPIYEDTDYGNGVIPFLTDAFQEIDAKVPYRSVIAPSATDDQILEELYKLMTMQTRVFVVHMFSSLGSRLFSKAKDVGMMSEGYVWIITDGFTDLLDSMDSSVIDSMQGVLGVKPYVPKSMELDNFAVRWKRKILLENPSITKAELSIIGLWAYDTVQALAMAVEQVGAMKFNFLKPKTSQNSTDLASLGVSETGPKLLDAILNTTFKGLSGEFHLVNGQMQSSAFQIINVVGKGGRGIGFWTPVSGLSRVLNKTKTYSATMDDLKPVIWPGESTALPRGWVIPTSGKKLRIGVPVKVGFSEFVKVEGNPGNSLRTVTGFCIDVFDAVREQLLYALPYEFVPFENANGQSAGSYDDLVYQIYLQRLDAVVGDTTIVANRSLYVDFTLPYTDSGVSMVVPIKDDESKNAWIFLKPLSRNLWLTSAAAFVFTGFVVWVLEHQINEEFMGSRSHQIGIIFWFSFSTLVFAHKEKVLSNLARFVMIIWLFVVLILTSSYTASLTSMLTVQQLRPTITDVNDLIKNKDYVGYQQGSFVLGLLKRLNFDESRLRVYNSPDEYAVALSKGSANGGVAAFFDEIPYIQLFLGQNCGLYTMVGPTYKTDGFGFAFPRGSPLVPDFSRAILNVTEGDRMVEIEKKWFGQQTSCSDRSASQAAITSSSLTLDSFWGLFLIAGTASALALFIFMVHFLYQHWHILPTPEDPEPEPVTTFPQWIAHLAKRFIDKDHSYHAFKKAAEPVAKPAAEPIEGQAIIQAGVIDGTSPAHTNAPLSPMSTSDASEFNPREGGTSSSEIWNQDAFTSADMHNRNATGEITKITEHKDLR